MDGALLIVVHTQEAASQDAAVQNNPELARDEQESGSTLFLLPGARDPQPGRREVLACGEESSRSLQ